MRWDLIAALREVGPMTVADLARHLGRHYKNVHADVQQLIEWMAVERGADGRVSVPWSEIVVDMKLPERKPGSGPHDQDSRFTPASSHA